MFNFVIFGPPGSGKGTQSKNIIAKYNLVHLSTGDLLRTEQNTGSELGKQISALIDDGNFVPDEMIQKIFKAFLFENKNSDGFILDGFPRNTKQAAWLDNLLEEMNSEVKFMLALEVDDDELKRRILDRGKISGRPDDQNESIVETRITVYNKQTIPVKEYYENQNKFHSVKGVGKPDEVFANICGIIDKLK